ncbi:MAG: hypothetical protein QXW29_04880 [Thermoplasmatales archaeon]
MDVYKIPTAKKQEMEKILAVDPVFRLSVTTKDSSVLGDGGFIYLILEGSEERLKVAHDMLMPISVTLKPEEKKKVESMIENERKNVYDSMGSLFG